MVGIKITDEKSGRSFGIHLGDTTESVVVTKGEFQFNTHVGKILGRVVAPDRIEGTYYAVSLKDSVMNCEESSGVWTASPK
jgi:hypothetical protein